MNDSRNDTASSPSRRRSEHELTRLLAMSFERAASPAITLRALSEQEDRNSPYGWGFAWYPDEAPSALVVKDPTSIGENAMTKLLREWERFESNLFLCHLRGAARTLEERDTHPFFRSYAGRDWIFAHNGDLFGDLSTSLPLGAPAPVFEPVGGTDSEHAFCWLLSRTRGTGARRLADVGWERLHAWFRELDALGTANAMFADGADLVVYRDEEGYNSLFWSRLVPPHADTLKTDDILIDLGDALEGTRTLVAVSTVPLEGATWTPMHPGQMLVLRRGAIIWDSHANEAAAPFITLPRTRTDAMPTASEPPIIQPLDRSIPRRVPLSTTDAVAPLALPPNTERVPGTSLLSIIHETRYRYTSPVERSMHLFRLRPVHDRTQQPLAFDLSMSVRDLRREYEDAFGNNTLRSEIEHPYTDLRIVSRSLVRVASTHEDLTSPMRRMTLPLVWMPWQRQMMLPYLLPPELPETQLSELYEFAMSFVERQEHDLVYTLLDINSTIRRDFRYESGSTTLLTTPFEVYANRRGVCQDFANLFICLARLLSIPARYRVGYIHTGTNYENTRQGDASHAWLEVYLPWHGWVGFDPTNGCLAGLDHVRVACGRNYRDATPTSGTIYTGGGAETLEVAVRVERIE